MSKLTPHELQAARIAENESQQPKAAALNRIDKGATSLESNAISSDGQLIDLGSAEVRPRLAPWWHTTLMVLLITGTSILGSRHTRQGGLARSHMETYALTIAWEWILAGVALWGLWLRKIPIRQVIGRWSGGIRAWMTDLGGALLFWIMAMTCLAVVSVLLQLLHMENAQKKLAELAPQSLGEMAIWIVVSLSAGICEEFVFRGYLQRQFSLLSGRVWAGVLCSSLLFGAAHGYEGLSGMIIIALFGAMFSVLAIWSRGLRMGMIAHGWHDTFTGALLALAKALHTF